MCLLQPAVVYKTIREGAHGVQSEKPLRLPFNIITVVLTERQVAVGECWGQIPGEKCVCVCVRVSRKRCTFGHGWSTHCTLGKAFSSVHQQRAIRQPVVQGRKKDTAQYVTVSLHHLNHLLAVGCGPSAVQSKHNSHRRLLLFVCGLVVLPPVWLCVSCMFRLLISS